MKQLVNVTEITSWLYCPRKLYLTKIKKFKQPLTKPMVLGKIKHRILELFSKHEKNLVIQIKRHHEGIELFSLYENYLNKIAEKVFYENSKLIKAFSINTEELFEEILKEFTNDLELRINSIKETTQKGFYGSDLWENLTPKYISELKLESDNLCLKGRIDRVEVNKQEKKLIPYELKTRKKGIYLSDEIQLTAYAMLLEDRYKMPIKKGIIESGNKKQEITIKEEHKEMVLDIIQKIKSLNENSNPEFPSNFNKCKSCSLEESCFKKAF